MQKIIKHKITARTAVQLLQSLPTLPANPQLQYTACTIIQRYACWLSASAVEDPSLTALMPPLLKLTMAVMTVHDASGGAALAFASVCYNCAPFVRELLPDMLQLLNGALRVETWHGAGSMRGKGGLELEEEDVYSIIDGITTVVSVAAGRNDKEVRFLLSYHRCIVILLSK